MMFVYFVRKKRATRRKPEKQGFVHLINNFSLKCLRDMIIH